jgi:hypothetical protein
MRLFKRSATGFFASESLLAVTQVELAGKEIDGFFRLARRDEAV